MLFRVSVFLVSLATISGYKKCDDFSLAYRFDGYTYTVDPASGERFWSHCAFPNPLFDHVMCGWEKTDGVRYLCDPDNVLADQSTRSQVDAQLSTIRTKTATLCTDSEGRDQSFIVMVALIDRIRLPDLESQTLCQNECGLLYPVLNQTSSAASYPTDAQQYEILANFAEGLRTEWSVGSCGNDVIVLYCKEFNKIYIASGRQASLYLTGSRIDKLSKKVSEYLNTGNFQQGLRNGLDYLLDELQVYLQGLTFAQKILIVSMSVVAIFAVWFFVYLVIREKELNIWGKEQPWLFFEHILRTISGLWIVEGTMYFMINLSHSGGNAFMLTGLAVLFVVCVVAYYFSRQVIAEP